MMQEIEGDQLHEKGRSLSETRRPRQRRRREREMKYGGS